MELKLELGGKAKGLNWLAKNTDLCFKVLNFEVIDSSYHEDFLKQPLFTQLAELLYKKVHPDEKVIGHYDLCPKRLDERCTELIQKFNGKGVIVRSSGVIFEDNNNFSGAGIYDSFIIDKNRLNSKSLQDAVLDVYLSINKPRAVKYAQEAGLGNERMSVVVQEFLESDWSGVMYTSNPSYPKDLSIEFIEGRNRVVDGADGSYIIDFNKRTKKRIFESENLCEDLPFDIDALVNLGINIEKRAGPSDIEFLVKDKEFYIIQKRAITDLQEPCRVKIPKYNPEQFIGSSKLKRGTGKVKLPVVRFSDIADLMQSSAVLALVSESGVKEVKKRIQDYFKNVIDQDSKFSSGYILLLPHFHQSTMGIYSKYITELNIKGELSYDFLTSNKKAIITTKSASISSHVMTIAREKGISYVGFSYSDELFNHVQTGDILSIYFQGREAKIFLENSPLRNIHESNPQITFESRTTSEGHASIQTSGFLESTKPYTDDFLLYLNSATGQEWKFEPFRAHMGGSFVNKEGRHILMQMSRMASQYHTLDFTPSEYSKLMGYKPMLKKQLQPLIDGYVKHLTSR